MSEFRLTQEEMDWCPGLGWAPGSRGANRARARTSGAAVAAPRPAPEGPRLLDRLRQALRSRHYSPSTEKAYVAWVTRYVLFHDKKHPREMGAEQVASFLASLATEGKVCASTQNQAFSALLFLYRLCAPEHKRGYVAAPAMSRSGWRLLSVAGE